MNKYKCDNERFLKCFKCALFKIVLRLKIYEIILLPWGKYPIIKQVDNYCSARLQNINSRFFKIASIFFLRLKRSRDGLKTVRNWLQRILSWCKLAWRRVRDASETNHRRLNLVWRPMENPCLSLKPAQVLGSEIQNHCETRRILASFEIFGDIKVFIFSKSLAYPSYIVICSKVGTQPFANPSYIVIRSKI